MEPISDIATSRIFASKRQYIFFRNAKATFEVELYSTMGITIDNQGKKWWLFSSTADGLTVSCIGAYIELTTLRISDHAIHLSTREYECRQIHQRMSH
jgi:hypothetical protein